MQHPALGQADVQALPRAGDRHIHQAALFFQPGLFQDAVLVREQPLFQAGNEDGVEFQAFGRVHRHQNPASGVRPSEATMGASTTPGISIDEVACSGTTPAGMPS
ncbi:hypothetical protein G6F22_021301 [Rhizopus arrhizus]|uniref:Uncharacterized protein n=1 Tax=Rhizopus delemar TaxID=936053 RepID=A0A9P7C0D9_9FUNG|nr:hypothetical protein G6F24_017752 [Rhizopus arrhizus]KAG0753799.1 hypothetical protein G6F22_021301 [Rhizopus arrhizus]KAG1530468.1 hypothetical protein G6F50_017298 [Rhizopus delemar]